jgi:hypothetical protein
LLLTLEDALNVTGRKPELVETGMPWRANVIRPGARSAPGRIARTLFGRAAATAR